MNFSEERFPAAHTLFLSALLAVSLIFFLCQKTDFTRADLGRHLQTGRLLVQNAFHPEEWPRARKILSTNFYSFTFPDAPAPNHHWASGVVFFLVWNAFGFAGLGAFHLALYAAAFFILFWITFRETGLDWALLVSLFLAPLLVEREEIRPEAFSVFFSAVYFWVLWRYREGRLSARGLWVLPVLQILWANLHIYFFLGPAIIGAFFKSLLFERRSVRPLFFLSLVVLVVSCLNPSGLDGFFYPFRIFKNYGADVVENQSVWYLERIGRGYPSYLYFKITLALSVLSFVLVFLFRRARFSPFLFLVCWGFGILACLAIRNLALFGFFALPALAINLKALVPERWTARRTPAWTAAAGAVLFLAMACSFSKYLPHFRHHFGLGIRAGNNRSADYFKRTGIRGPIFNNFDSGGFLIFHLFPRERVFLDNRSEAYPASFIREYYKRVYGDAAVWKSLNERYRFNAIYLSQELNPQLKQFVSERLRDPDWALAYWDLQSMIFIRREGANAALAAKLPGASGVRQGLTP